MTLKTYHCVQWGFGIVWGFEPAGWGDPEIRWFVIHLGPWCWQLTWEVKNG